MPQLEPVDHDPFAPATMPVDHDPFADDALAGSMTHWADRPNPAAPIVEMGGLIARHFRDKAVSALTAPRDAFTGAMRVTDPETGMPTREALERGQSVANLAMTGGVPFAKQGAAGIFGGRLAKTADQAALEEATNMLKTGASKEDIWNKTGWFQGADDKWRFEIPDTAASNLKTQIDIPHERAAVGDVRVGDVFEHNALFEAYPGSKNSPFTRDTEGFTRGHYQPETGQVGVAKMSQPGEERSTMLHELQHGIQSTEGFAEGANPFGIRGNMPENPDWQKWATHPAVQEFNRLHNSGAYHSELNDANKLWREKYQPDMRALESQWIPRGDKAGHEARQEKFDALFAAYNKEIAGKFPITERVEALDRQLKAEGLSGKEPRRYLDAMDVYKAHAGEVEARNVQTRRDMTPEQRRAAPPWTTEDVPRAQQIVRGATGGPQMSMPEGKGLKVADDGTRINIAPENMQVPDWGKGLSWGLTAYRSKVKGEDAIHVRDARLPPEMQGQGHGTAMYEHAAGIAAKEGKPLLSDGTVTQDAANRWMALNRAGYNVQMAPDKVFRPGPPEAPHLGRFETPDGSPVFRVEPGKSGTLSDFITAYHGSPHDFDRFDLSKIGTGEGAQAYGHGLYFAENEGVAKQYRADLADKTYLTGNGKDRAAEPYGGVYQALEMNAGTTGVHPDISRAAATNVLKAVEDSGSIEKALKEYDFPVNDPRAGKAYQEAIAAAQRMNLRANKGRMYQVAIKAPPEHFLDWDKPLSEQHPKVREAMLSIPEVRKQHEHQINFLGPDKGLTGESAYAAAAKWKRGADLSPDNPEQLTQTLREAGIPGIKYLDQGSRGQQADYHAMSEGGKFYAADYDKTKQSGPFDTREDAWKWINEQKKARETRNFVVFDDKLIDILKKYGIAGIAALPAMNAYTHRTQPVDHDPFAP